MVELTEKQREVLQFIHSHFETQGLAPSVREIAEALGKSAQAIQQHIESLRAKGYLQHQPSKSRANVPRQLWSRLEPDRVVEVPILGRVQAGLPLLAEENLEGSLPLPREWAKGDAVFALRVKGDSMKDCHILPGDLAVVRQQADATNGDVVVARLHQTEVTLKRIFKHGTTIVLKAENPKYKPIEVSANEVEVVGRVIGIYRKLA